MTPRHVYHIARLHAVMIQRASQAFNRNNDTDEMFDWFSIAYDYLYDIGLGPY